MSNREEAYSTALKDILYIMQQYKDYKPEAWETVRKIVNKALHPVVKKEEKSLSAPFSTHINGVKKHG